jgi:hypothetical protein
VTSDLESSNDTMDIMIALATNGFVHSLKRE